VLLRPCPRLRKAPPFLTGWRRWWLTTGTPRPSICGSTSLSRGPTGNAGSLAWQPFKKPSSRRQRFTGSLCRQGPPQARIEAQSLEPNCDRAKTTCATLSVCFLDQQEVRRVAGEITERTNAKPRKEKLTQVCFTGFSVKEKEESSQLANNANLEVVGSVTKKLAFLCCGENAGPAKLQSARDKGCLVLNKTQFLLLLETGELPN
jgi:hypothetical protein